MDLFDDYYRKRQKRTKSPPKLSREALVLQNNAYQLQLQRYEIFKKQNPETGNFDLTFEFSDGKVCLHLYYFIYF